MEDSYPPADSTSPRWLPWLQLLRLPNVFTAIADVSMGYLLGGGRSWGGWLPVVAATCCLYLAGMVLNDVFDAELDRVERPSRPIPSGRIPRRHAAALGWWLLAAGIACGWLAGRVAGTPGAPAPAFLGWLRPDLLGVLLAANIVLYDGLLKTTWLGPLAMGMCRSLNILLGMSVTADAAFWQESAGWLAAAGIGVYVMGVTWFARHEAGTSPRAGLLHGAAWMLAGQCLLVLVAPAGRVSSGAGLEGRTLLGLLLALYSIPVWGRAAWAIRSQTGRDVQMTVREALLTLPFFDFCLTWILVGGTPALAIMLLVLPARYLSRWIRVT